MNDVPLRRAALCVLLLLSPPALGHDEEELGPRFVTSRPGDVVLPLPGEEEAFSFVIFGDRTGGPSEGIQVLEQAVEEVNVIEPDLVMTVGDLIEGYNETPEWLVQMHEFKSTMRRLECPWFPVAGNHDTYWRGPEGERPAGEHDADYETHFGPLWYAFRHKTSWFVVLYSDEGNPETGEKNFDDPAAQVMSDEQFTWLSELLQRTGSSDHVFVFVHHPRWLSEQYGEDWKRVHRLLVEAGNVTAVFAGHIHSMRYDGVQDGIEYFTLATVGGWPVGDIPQAGYLHQYHLVTVRPERVAVAAFPVGSAFDPREITGRVSEETRQLSEELTPEWQGTLTLGEDLSVDGTIALVLENPVSRPVELTLAPTARDPRWSVFPEHLHARLESGARESFALRVQRAASAPDPFLGRAELVVRMDYLTESRRFEIPSRSFPFPLDVTTLPAPATSAVESVLACDGESGHVAVPHEAVLVPDGPFTVEGWLRAESFGSRVGWLAKTESAEFAIFVSDGAPEFSVHLDGAYVSAEAPGPLLSTGSWHHVAGVFDGEELRLYVDGERVAAAPGSGSRTVRDVPFLVGADVRGDGSAASHFHGQIDEVRLSVGARYTGEHFTPERRFTSDEDTRLLLHMDGAVGEWVHDSSPVRAHGTLAGEATIVPNRTVEAGLAR